jgi:3',5'-cyclic AMP phosphodiesterase CpdA
MRFLHCSDVHITEDYGALPFFRLGWRRWIALAELKYGGRAKAYVRAHRTLAQIAEDFRAHRADHLIVSGDLTAYALEGEFKGARESLGQVANDRAHCTIIPGNHDVYTPGAFRTGRFEKYFGHLIESDLPEYRREGAYPFVRLLGDEVAVVGLRSARVPPVPGLSYGVIGRDQLAGLRELVNDARVKHRAVLVVVHHAPLGHHGRPDKRFHGLMDARQLFQAVPGPRFAVLHGHIHRRYHHAASSTRPHTFGAGSSTQEGREGYWLIDVEDGRIKGATMHGVGAPHQPPIATAAV